MGWIVVANADGVRVAGAGTLTLVDPTTGSLTPVGHGSWDYDFTVLTGDGHGTVSLGSGTTLWELGLDGTVIHRFDLGLGYIDAVHVTSFDGEGLWVAAAGLSTGNVVARVDIDTGRILERYRVGQGVHEIADAGGYVFVASRSSARTVVRIDPSTGETRTVPGIPSGEVAIGGVADRLWIEEGSVQEGPIVHCIIAADFAPCGAVAIPWAYDLATDGRFLWVLSGRGLRTQRATVTLIDGTTGHVLGGPVVLPAHPSAERISAYAGRAWVGFHDSGLLVGIRRCTPGSCATSG